MTVQQYNTIDKVSFHWQTYKLAGYMNNMDINTLKELGQVHKELYPLLPFPNLRCTPCVIDLFKNLFILFENAEAENK